MGKHIGRDYIEPGYRLRPYGELRKTLQEEDPLSDNFAAPYREGMKLGKHRNFDGRGIQLQTGPLRRWLGKQAGKPWAQVRADITRLLRRKSEWHMREWLVGIVEQKAYLTEAGEVVYYGVYEGERSVSAIEFYVHPITERLIWNSNRPGWKRGYRERVASKAADTHKNRRIIDRHHVLCKLSDIWYHLTLREIEPDEVFVSSQWDAAGLLIHASDAEKREALYGDQRLMCVNKRQMSSKEIRQRKLY